MKTSFFRCNICGNVVIKAIDSGVMVECCSEYMEELTPKTTEEGAEKHLPVVTKTGDNIWKVEVGSTAHPMLKEHYIEFIYFETRDGGQIAYIYPGMEPQATFYSKDKPVAVYEYCNKHGLWKTEVK
ncbi:MAG: desulfoferrodoxin [Bacteroidales bacterium]|nr:desulfoferrodoxin [Bacteroidales bacterium]